MSYTEKNKIFLRNSWPAKLLMILLLALIYQHWQIILYPFQHEYREAAPMISTSILLNGRNPYSILEQPQATNVYGIIYSLAMLPIIHIFGLNISTFRLVSGIFIVLICILINLIFRKWQISQWLSSAGSIILYTQLINTSSMAMPNALGMFLFLGTSLIPYLSSYSISSLFIASILGVLAFLTKPYFLLGVVNLMIYLIFTKSWKALSYLSIFFVTIFTITLIGIDRIFPLYWNNTFFIHTKVATYDFNYLCQQSLNYLLAHLGLIAIMVSVFATSLHVKSKGKNEISSKKIILWDEETLLIWCCLITNLIVFVFKLGGHPGSAMYPYQILSPFFLLIAFKIINQLTLRKIHVWLIVSVICYSAANIIFWNNSNYLGYQRVTELVEKSRNVYGSPAVASIIFEKGKKVQDNGQSEYFIDGGEKQILFGGLLHHEDKRVINQYEKYRDQLKLDIKNNYYDLFLIAEESPPFVHSSFPERKILQEYYVIQEKISLAMSFSGQKIRLEVWTPKKIML